MFFPIIGMNNDLEKASSRMKEEYRTSMRTLRIENLKTGIYRNGFYVDLAIADSIEVDEDWRLHSDREYHLANYLNEKQTLDCNDLLSVNDKFLILRGIAGVGKTSLTKYLLFQWANGKIWNETGNRPFFKFVFRFTCRKLNLIQSKISIKGLFERFYPYVPFEDLLTERDIDVLVVLDGLDEFCELSEILQSAPSSLTDEMSIGGVMYNILMGIFDGQRTILSSRPESANVLYSTLGRSLNIKRVDVVGFSKAKVSEYVSNFTDNIKKPHLKERILSKIDEHQNLTAMSQIPVYLWIMCSIFEDNIDIPAPKTNTELYIWLFGVYLREHLKDFKKSPYTRSLSDVFSDERCQSILKILSHLSYEMISKGKVLFYEKDITALEISIGDIPTEESGFITKKSDVRGNVYQFKHLVLHEFLSACYLVTKSEALIEEILGKNCLINVIPLIAGLQGMVIYSQSSNLIKSFTKSLGCSTEAASQSNILNKIHNFYCLIASVFEFAKDIPETCRIEIVRQLNRSDSDFQIIHYHQLNYFLHFMNQILFRNDAVIESGDRRNDTIISIKHWHITIDGLELNVEQLGSLFTAFFCAEYLGLQNVKSNEAGGFKLLAENVLASHSEGRVPTLEILVFVNCSLDAVKLSWIAKFIPFIQRVSLLNNEGISEDGFEVLANEIISAKHQLESENKNISLKRLGITCDGFNENHLSALAKALPCIQEVNLSRNSSIGTAGFEVLANAIISAQGEAEKGGKNITLKKLYLSDCSIDDNKLIAFSKAIPYIQEVDFSHNKSIGNAGFEGLAKVIISEQGETVKGDKSIALRKLHLFHCSIDDKKLIEFSKALPYI